MLDNADQLLIEMKHWLDNVFADNQQIQNYLQWVEQKSTSVQTKYRLVAVRAYYFCNERDLERTRSPTLARALARALDFDLALARALAHDFARTRSRSRFRSRDLAHDLDRDLAFNLAHDLALCLKRKRVLDLAYDLALTLDRAGSDSENTLQIILQHLKDQLPVKLSQETQIKWWQSNGQKWIDQLRAAMIEHRNIGHDWQLSKKQRQLLQQYYDANQLLVDCLNSDCYVSREVRAAIEDQLLLPMASLAKLPPLKP
jgi:hypothetical protein